MSSHEMHVILTGVVGSQAYGMDTPESDEDKLSVFAYDTDVLLGLDEYKSSVVYTNPDHTFHEVKKFVMLAMKSNPTITEMLWLDDYEHINPLGASLLNIRESMLSKPYVRNAYLGYSTSQLERLKRRFEEGETHPKSAKHARHLARLLDQGLQLYMTGKLQVRLDSEKRDQVFEFGEMVALDPSLGTVALERYERAFLEAESRSPLPDAPDRAKVNAWLLMVRETFR